MDPCRAQSVHPSQFARFRMTNAGYSYVTYVILGVRSGQKSLDFLRGVTQDGHGDVQ